MSSVKTGPKNTQAPKNYLHSWQVIAIYEQYESSPGLIELDTEVQRVIESCTELIQNASSHFRRKYEASMMPSGSGNVMKNMTKKVEFAVREKSNIQELRDKIRSKIETLTLLMNITVQ